ncbi:MAG: right-handed parallel beta-helix repeat-containing protein [Niallia sp.]
MSIRKHKNKHIVIRHKFIFVIVGLLLISACFLYLNKEETSSPPKPLTNVNVQDFGAEGNGKTDDTNGIQKALNLAKNNEDIVTVHIPKGIYKLSETLVVYSNTHLILEDGAIILRDHLSSMLVNGEANHNYYGYNGEGNITIEGGTFDGNIQEYPTGFNGIGIARGSNITIKNVTIKDIAQGHAIDINASKNVLIENCKFIGYSDPTADHSRNYTEAIQIAEHTKMGFPRFGAYDGTPSKNITIQENYFGNSDTTGASPWPVGVGNHLTVQDKYNSNIKIINNTFDGMPLAGVRPYKWQDTTISNNTFLSCYIGVLLSNPNGEGESSRTADGVQTSQPQSGSNYTIHKNIFNKTQKDGIYGRGWNSNNTLSTMNTIKITENIFNNQDLEQKGSAINLSWIEDVVIEKNEISNVYRSIYLTFGSNISILQNKMSSIASDAILIDEPNNPLPNNRFTKNILVDNNTIRNFAGV